MAKGLACLGIITVLLFFSGLLVFGASLSEFGKAKRYRENPMAIIEEATSLEDLPQAKYRVWAKEREAQSKGELYLFLGLLLMISAGVGALAYLCEKRFEKKKSATKPRGIPIP